MFLSDSSSFSMEISSVVLSSSYREMHAHRFYELDKEDVSFTRLKSKIFV